MILYYSVAVMLSLFAYLDIVAQSKYFKPIYVFYSFLCLFLLAGLRGYEFSDYGNYERIFNHVYDLVEFIQHGGNPSNVHGEYLYLLLNTLVKTITDHSVYVFVIVALLAVGINIYCFYKYSPYAMVSVLLYFSHLYLNKELIQIRAGLGGALVLLSVLFIIRKQALYFLLTVVIATLFHSGAIIALPIYWLTKYSYKKMTLFLPILAGLFLSQVDWLDGFLLALLSFGLVPDGIITYMGVGVNHSELGALNPITVKQLMICTFAIYYKDVLYARLKYFKPLLIMYILSTSWLLAFQDFSLLAARIATFLSVGDPVIIPSLAILFREKKLVLVCIILLAWAMLYLNLGIKKFIPPYQSIFDFI